MKDNDRRRFNRGTQKITDEQILAGISAGMTRQEIADLYGVHVENLARRMSRLGVHATYASTKPRVIFGDAWHYIESHDKLCKEQHQGFIYLESKKKNVRLKCKRCGAIIERNLSTVRRNQIICEECKKHDELMKARAELMRVLYAIQEKSIEKTCPCCGKSFYSEYPNKIWCSEKCRKRGKKKGRTSTIRRRCKKYGVTYVPGITRDKVIERDNNICQICGKPCDSQDLSWGNSGPLFPTIDHIRPLAKGGSHTWDNVQLAHGICNSYKRDLAI